MAGLTPTHSDKLPSRLRFISEVKQLSPSDPSFARDVAKLEEDRRTRDLYSGEIKVIVLRAKQDLETLLRERRALYRQTHGADADIAEDLCIYLQKAVEQFVTDRM